MNNEKSEVKSKRDPKFIAIAVLVVAAVIAILYATKKPKTTEPAAAQPQVQSPQ